MNPLGLVKLTSLMERASGSPEVKIGLIDGRGRLERTSGSFLASRALVGTTEIFVL
jgi:hypothetical protein